MPVSHSYTHTLIHSYTRTLIHSYTHTLIHSYPTYTQKRKQSELVGPNVIMAQCLLRSYLARKHVYERALLLRSQAERYGFLNRRVSQLLCSIQLRILQDTMNASIGVKYDTISKLDCPCLGPVQAIFVQGAMGSKGRTEQNHLFSNRLDAGSLSKFLNRIKGLTEAEGKGGRGGGGGNALGSKRRVNNKIPLATAPLLAVLEENKAGRLPMVSSLNRVAQSDVDVSFQRAKSDPNAGNFLAYADFFAFLKLLGRAHYMDKTLATRRSSQNSSGSPTKDSVEGHPNSESLMESLTRFSDSFEQGCHGTGVLSAVGQAPMYGLSAPAVPPSPSPSKSSPSKSPSKSPGKAKVPKERPPLKLTIGKLLAKPIALDQKTIVGLGMHNSKAVLETRLYRGIGGIGGIGSISTATDGRPIDLDTSSASRDIKVTVEEIDYRMLLVWKMISGLCKEPFMVPVIQWIDKEAKARLGYFAIRIQNLYRIRKSKSIADIMAREQVLRDKMRFAGQVYTIIADNVLNGLANPNPLPYVQP